MKKALQVAARLGVEGIEIDARGELKPKDFSRTALRQFRKMLDDLNLRVCAVSFPTRRGYERLDDLEARIAATKEAMSFAYDLGAPVVVNQIGQIAEEDSTAWKTMLESLTELGIHGQRVGAMLAARTGAESGEDLARLIDALPPVSLAVDFDPGNLLVNGFSAHDALGHLSEHVLHVHARDAVRDLAKGRGLETQLGRGSADFPEILARLEERDYRGYFTVGRDGSPDPEQEFSNAVEYLRNLLL